MLDKGPPSDVDLLLESFYEKARCGLYHMAQTQSGIVLSGDPVEVIRFDTTNRVLVINPHRLPTMLKDYLENYRKRLLDPANADLRQKFERRYDYDNPFPTLLSSSSGASTL